MTVGRNGIFGRWGDHLGRALEKSSFQRRLNEFDDSAWQRMDDLVIFWADMGGADEFLTLETSHREGVEYLVQRQLRVLLARGNPPLNVISKVRSNRTVQLPLVQTAANQVVGHFQAHFDAS
ncbi:hypothetical protein AA958_18765 [Streptomyces sp. CNQ-509]|uniref:hypothetical protein n=1 Tax=Streptomyces sp. CNQ-509 TaxID=444103 RepID=UPI00062E0407|nr:hypothetical protein [Streptomyces sp. CNQ-509]AKH83902.1 hypothetical protein AA958_18765 [Streptomyces sp. CNQ-509]